MSNILGTIKITDLKIVTKKDGKVEVWSATRGDESKFIIYKGRVYKLLTDE